MIEQASASLSDGEAAKSPELFPRWADHIGETVKPGDRRSDTDESGVLHVYRVNKGQGHTTQENWPPHSTPAMWTIINVDSTINAQRPKMAPHIPQMIAHLAADLQLPDGRVNVKAKTAECLGFVGREEGMSADAVALIEAAS